MGPDTPPLAEADRRHLERAIELGRRGWGRVHPNPMVGCVVVRDGATVAEGWHREFGGPHAEVEALRQAGDDAHGATAYVSLEPCAHEGKTPPCTRALLEAGVSRVVYGAADPGTDSGGGGRELRRAGVDVVGPVLGERRARAENPRFFTAGPGRPWVEVKLALSLDGAIAGAPGERTSVTGPEAWAEVHRLRAGFDAVVVGGHTARIDDPLLTARGEPAPRIPPSRIVFDPLARLPAGARLLSEGEGNVIVMALPSAPSARVEALRARGAEVLECPPDGPDPSGRPGVGGSSAAEGEAGPLLDLESALEILGKSGIRTLLCEGGGRLATALMNAGLVDRLHLVIAPVFFGRTGVSAFSGVRGHPAGAWTPSRAPRTFGVDHWITLDAEEPCSRGS
jgi:diaminohydroxyphosphoribosylaminopyrimidine deaminase / 5-amino-6-(5-phosphoribosylamino)uracil reductase